MRGPEPEEVGIPAGWEGRGGQGRLLGGVGLGFKLSSEGYDEGTSKTLQARGSMGR